jgi:hypothetical protein
MRSQIVETNIKQDSKENLSKAYLRSVFINLMRSQIIETNIKQDSKENLSKAYLRSVFFSNNNPTVFQLSHCKFSLRQRAFQSQYFKTSLEKNY